MNNLGIYTTPDFELRDKDYAKGRIVSFLEVG